MSQAADPLARIAALDSEDRRRLAVSLLVTVLLYGVGVLRIVSSAPELHAFARSTREALMRVEYHVDIQEPPPPPPPPVEEPAPEPKVAPTPLAKVPSAPPAAPPPAAAQAGHVLTADPDAPVDLTGDGFVQGTADSYAGGVTSSTGTSKTAMRDTRAAPTGGPVAAPAVRSGPEIDRSSPARPTSGSWDHCGFPAEADVEQVNYARATIAVTIGADGQAKSVSVVKDPGYGFGALAKRCALRERFEPARGRDGTPVTATQVITINFHR